MFNIREMTFWITVKVVFIYDFTP